MNGTEPTKAPFTLQPGDGDLPPRHTAWRTAARVAGGALLLASGLAGLYNGPADLLRSPTFVERLVEGMVVLYGVMGTVAGMGVWLGRRWALPAAWTWASLTVIVSGLAPVAFAPGKVPWAAIVATAAGTATLALAVVLVARAGLPKNVREHPSAGDES